MSPRATWKGLLTIRLVSIPIKVFPAAESSEGLHFHQLHESCQTHVTQRKWCVSCGREVPSVEIVKGYEFEAGKYVLLLEAELDAVKPPSAKAIDLVQFAPVSSLPWMAIERAYYLAPDGPEDGPASEAFAVVGEAMAGQVGIGKLAIYGREYLVAISPQGRSLLLYTLHHAAELREAPYAWSARSPGAPSPAERLARQIIAALSRSANLAQFRDDYRADVQRLIDAKIAGQEIIEPTPIETRPVLPLLEALQQSLTLASAAKKIPAKAAAPAKRTRAS